MNNKFVRSQDGCGIYRVCDIERVEILYNDDSSVHDRIKNLFSAECKEPNKCWYEVTFFMNMNLGIEDNTVVMATYSTEELANSALTMFTRFLNSENLHTFRFSSEEWIREH